MVERAEKAVVARCPHRQPMHIDSVQRRGSRLEVVGPIAIARRTRCDHVDLMSALDQPFCQCPARRLRAARDLLAVALRDEEQSHQWRLEVANAVATTRPIASTARAAVCSGESASATARPRARNSSRNGASLRTRAN